MIQENIAVVIFYLQVLNAMALAKKEASKKKIVEAAGQAFRAKGFGGIGVDGLAKGAGLTSGAFYFHFGSKLDAFVESLKAGLEDLRCGIEEFQTKEGRQWLRRFAAFYMGTKRTCEPGASCSLPLLSPEVERAGPQAQGVYQEQLLAIAGAVAHGLSTGHSMSRRDRSWAILAMISGGLNMARAVEDPELSGQIAAAVQKAVMLLDETELSGRRVN